MCVCVVKTASAGRISRWNCSVAQKDQNVAEEKLVLKGKKERKKRNLYGRKKWCLWILACECVFWCSLSRCTHRRIEGLEAESTTPAGLDNLAKTIQ